MKSFKEIILPAVILFVICVVATALLALTDDVTAPKIAEREVQAENESRIEVLADAKTFGDSRTVTYEGGEYTYNEGFDADGNVIGYTFKTSAKGYGGDVVIVTGVDTNGTVTGIATLTLNETAGLGMNAQKESFRNQYIGKSGVIGVSSSSKKADNGIDAMTGATITSRAVTRAVNIALELYAQEMGGAD